MTALRDQDVSPLCETCGHRMAYIEDSPALDAHIYFCCGKDRAVARRAGAPVETAVKTPPDGAAATAERRRRDRDRVRAWRQKRRLGGPVAASGAEA
jgi:hypothetical protein